MRAQYLKTQYLRKIRNFFTTILLGAPFVCAAQSEYTILKAIPSGNDSIFVGQTYLVPVPSNLATESKESAIVLQLHDVATGAKIPVADQLIDNSYLKWVVAPADSGLKRLLIVDSSKDRVLTVGSSYFRLCNRPNELLALSSSSIREVLDGSKLIVSSREQLIKVIRDQSGLLASVTQIGMFSYDGRCLGEVSGGNSDIESSLDTLFHSFQGEKFVIVRVTFRTSVMMMYLVK